MMETTDVPSNKQVKPLLSSEKLYECPRFQPAKGVHRDMQQCIASGREANVGDTWLTDLKTQ